MNDHARRAEPGLRLARAGLITNALLALGKGVAGVAGNSFALIADSVESIGDILGSLVVWSGLRVSVQVPDRDHPYGHGKAEPIAAAVVGVMLMLAGAGILVQSIRGILTPHAPPEAWTLLVLVGVIVIKEGFFRRVLQVAAETHSDVMRADAWHHRSDAISSLAAFIGIGASVVIGPQLWWADEAAAIVAGLFIIANGASVMRPALHDLMDGALDAELLARVREVAESVSGVDSTEKLFARRVGSRIWIDLHVQADARMSLYDAHELGHRVTHEIRTCIPLVENVLVHMEPSVRTPDEAR